MPSHKQQNDYNIMEKFVDNKYFVRINFFNKQVKYFGFLNNNIVIIECLLQARHNYKKFVQQGTIKLSFF